MAGLGGSSANTNLEVPPADMKEERTLERPARLAATVSRGGARWKRINAAFTEFLGWDERELLMLAFLDLVHPHDVDASRAAFAQVATGATDCVSLPCRFRAKDGGYHQIAWELHQTDTPETVFCVGEPSAASGSRQDALRQSEQRLRALLDHLPIGVWFADAEGIIRYGNAAAQRIWCGARYIGPDEFHEYKAWWVSTGEPVNPEDWAVVRAVRNGETSRDELIRIACFDGTHKIILNSAVPIRGEQGEIAGAAILNQDVTGSMEVEQALRDSELFYRQTLDSIPGMVFTTRPDGYCDFQSQQWVDFTGTPMSEHLGDGWNSLLHPEDRPVAMAAWQSAVQERGPYDLEYRVRRRDGAYEWFKVRGRPIRDEAGHIARWLGVAINIDGMKKAQDDLHRLNAELELRVAQRTAELQQRADQLGRLASELTLAEQRERRRLASLLHDDLQQLLVGAKLGLDLHLRRTGKDDAGTLKQVGALIDEAITKARSLTMDLSPPILHEAGLVAGLNWLSRWIHSTHGLEVEVKAEPGAGTQRDDVRVVVFQAVRELLFNVVKHAGASKAIIELATRGSEHLRLTVSDDGRGFDPATLLVHGRDLAAGFGIFSVRERLSALGGSLEIDSAPNCGARLTIIAPALRIRPTSAQDDHAYVEAQEVTLRSHDQAATPRSRRIRVLLADDHEVMRHGLSLLLAEEADFEVVAEASNGLEALEKAQQCLPDVVLMDFSMPLMDGVEATRRLSSILPDVKVIGLSMYEEADREAAMVAAGAVAYLSKAGRSEVLLGTIRRVCKPATEA